MRYNSKHKYNKDGSLNPRYKYRVRYLGINPEAKVKKFRHRRNVEKQGYKYKGKLGNLILNAVTANGIQIEIPVDKLLLGK